VAKSGDPYADEVAASVTDEVAAEVTTDEVAADPDSLESEGEAGDAPAWHRLERGEIDMATYFGIIVEQAPEVLGRAIDMDAYGRFMRTSAPGVHWQVVHRIRDLRGRVRLGLLTNNVKEFGEHWRSTFPIDELFDVLADLRAVQCDVITMGQYLAPTLKHSIPVARYVPPAELKLLRELVRRLDPLRLATASFGGHDLNERDIRDALLVAKLDFLSPHRPRNPKSPAQTESRSRECLAQMKQIGIDDAVKLRQAALDRFKAR
jgi:hypothetical protein